MTIFKTQAARFKTGKWNIYHKQISCDLDIDWLTGCSIGLLHLRVYLGQLLLLEMGKVLLVFVDTAFADIEEALSAVEELIKVA